MNSGPGLPAKAEGAGTARRGYGSGSLYQQAGNWYGRWHVDGNV
jgi:hypothetical protein